MLNNYYNYTYREISPYLRQTAETPASIFANVPIEEHLDLGPAKNDIVLRCMIGKDDCSASMDAYMTPDSFNCYTYKGSNQRSSVVGIENGLSLILAGPLVNDVEQRYVFTSSKENTRTLRAFFHEPGTRPQLVGNVFELLPGISTSVGLKQRNMVRINTPHSQCSRGDLLDDNTKQTYSSCIQECISDYYYKKCGCYNGYATRKDISDYCFHVDLDEIRRSIANGLCEIDTRNELNKNPTENECFTTTCHWNCNEIEYATSVAQSVWPDEARIHSLLNKLLANTPMENAFSLKWFWARLTKLYVNTTEHDSYLVDEQDILDLEDFESSMQQLVTNRTGNESYENVFQDKYLHLDIPAVYTNLSSLKEAETKWVKDTFYRLNVYFQDQIVELHQQVLSQSFADLWSSIGGVCGLWLGISSITVVEIIELCINMLKSCFRSDSNQGTNAKKNLWLA